VRNQVALHPQFDHIVLLSTPLETLLDRLALRTDSPYGTAPEELRRVHDDLQTVEPLLRPAAGHEIRTTAPLDVVVATVLRIVGV
jgi:hypothetical protein